MAEIIGLDGIRKAKDEPSVIPSVEKVIEFLQDLLKDEFFKSADKVVVIAESSKTEDTLIFHSDGITNMELLWYSRLLEDEARGLNEDEYEEYGNG